MHSVSVKLLARTELMKRYIVFQIDDMMVAFI